MVQVNKILFITLSNIGDAILTLPALDYLRANFPLAEITVVVGPRPREIFENSPQIGKVIVYDKKLKLRDKINLLFALKKEKFDIVIDLRNSLFGVFLPARYKTSPFFLMPNKIIHMREKHLYKTKKACAPALRTAGLDNKRFSLLADLKDKKYIDDILRNQGVSAGEKIIIISAGARSSTKVWDKDNFVKLLSSLNNEFKARIILAGDKDDLEQNGYITGQTKFPVIDLTNKTSIIQLAYLLEKATLFITNDSAVLHLGSYVNVLILAIFGPTDENKYGPWSDRFAVVKKTIFCRPCVKAQCRFANLKCLKLIKPEDVMRQARDILGLSDKGYSDKFKRILVVHTDRVGDVLLTTPIIKGLRQEYPSSYIAMIVRPYSRGIVCDNPYLDEVIIYDKSNRHKSWYNSIRFAWELRKKRFDLVVIFHPTNRIHIVAFLAGIKKRVGYDRKMEFLLTDKIKHTKQLGQKHELEYNLDLLSYLGIEVKDKSLYLPIDPASDKWINELLLEKGIKETDQLLIISPAAGAKDRVWPAERFAQVADRLIEKYNFKALVIGNSQDNSIAAAVVNAMRQPAINIAGQTSLSQLASLLKRSALLISNDSGPVHIACAVGVSVISIFGRNQKGLSPKRWGPVTRNSRVLHKDVGCIECLAHNCQKDFACLKAISIEEVIAAADSLLN